MTPTYIFSRGGRVVDAIFIGLAGFFCLGSIFSQLAPEPAAPLPAIHEAYDPALGSITSVDAAAAYISGEHGARDQKARADAADEFVRQRFFHAYSFFNPRQDWLAYLAGSVWIDLGSPVLPDDILHHSHGACSQQVIVFEALARRLGLDSASVRLDNHMAAAVRIGGQWQVYDADREISPRSYPLSRLIAGDPAVVAIYGKFGQTIDLRGQAAAGGIRLTDVDANPARNASLFHRVTHFLSIYGWLVFIALAALRLSIRRSSRASRPLAVLAA